MLSWQINKELCLVSPLFWLILDCVNWESYWKGSPLSWNDDLSKSASTWEWPQASLSLWGYANIFGVLVMAFVPHQGLRAREEGAYIHCCTFYQVLPGLKTAYRMESQKPLLNCVKQACRFGFSPVTNKKQPLTLHMPANCWTMMRKSSPWMLNPRYVGFQELMLYLGQLHTQLAPTATGMSSVSGNCCETSLCPLPLFTPMLYCHCLGRCGICWNFLISKGCTSGLY